MGEARSLEISGLRFVFRPEAGWRVLEDDPRYQPFLNCAGNGTHDEVHVRFDFATPDLRGLPILFDTGDAWRGYRDGQDTLIDMSPGGPDSHLWTARLHPDRKQVVVHCGTPLVAGAPAHATPSSPGSPAGVIGSGQDRGSILNPLRYPLDQILMLELLPALGGLVVHGAGAERNGVGLAFPGRSGAGKSTLMRLMRGAEGVQGLSDDRVVLRTLGGERKLFGTPWAGDERVAANASARLGAIVFLHQKTENRLVPIDRSEALKQLLPTACIPWFDPAGAAQGLSICGEFVGAIPAFELHFRPERSAISVLDSLW